MAGALRFSNPGICCLSATMGSSRYTKVAREYCGSVLWMAVSSGWITVLLPHTRNTTACRADLSALSAKMPKGSCGSTLRGAWHVLLALSWRLTQPTAEKRSENFFCRRGTEACGSAAEETLCVSEPTAPLQP